jgi:hypothetical protein
MKLYLHFIVTRSKANQRAIISLSSFLDRSCLLERSSRNDSSAQSVPILLKDGPHFWGAAGGGHFFSTSNALSNAVFETNFFRS